MEVEFILVADAVQSENGKLFVLGGGWRQFRSPTFPAVARVGIAVSILLSPEELNVPQSIRIAFATAGIDATTHRPPGTSAVVIELQAIVQPPTIPIDQGGQLPGQRSFLALNGAFPIPSSGIYEVRVLANDGTVLKAVDFEAVAAPPPQLMN